MYIADVHGHFPSGTGPVHTIDASSGRDRSSNGPVPFSYPMNADTRRSRNGRAEAVDAITLGSRPILLRSHQRHIGQLPVGIRDLTLTPNTPANR